MNSALADQLRAAYAGKQVLVTGHTGFKGGWLVLWLEELGAQVTGYALAPPRDPALFRDIQLDQSCRHVVGDVRDREALNAVVNATRPEVIFHLAAQSLVRRSYEAPLETIETNLLGTANLLEAVRGEGRPCAVVVVTSDKCYENREWVYGYRESDPMGGHDIYSMSKGTTELLVSSYRRSFFPPDRIATHGVALATARAGNVVGGGDWAADRIVPDAIRALEQKRRIPVRNPRSVRPWQHVLEPLGGYLLLGARLLAGPAVERARFCDAWNFGPRFESTRPVRDVVQALIDCWGQERSDPPAPTRKRVPGPRSGCGAPGGGWDDVSEPNALHEAAVLRLSIEKSQTYLGWAPRWDFDETFARTAAWYRARHEGARPAELRALTLAQIRDYVGAAETACPALAAA